MIKELTDYYHPDRIIHRDHQILTLKKVFKNFKEVGMASNIVIMGVTGSGKTTVLNKIIEEENGNGIKIYSSSAAINRTSFKTFKSMFDVKCNTHERLLSESIKQLKKKPGIIIIDEVNKIKNISSFFNDLNTLYRETTIPIIIITNKRNIYDDLPEDAKLTLFFERIEFPPYNAIQIYDIISDRISIIEEHTKLPPVPEGSLKYISALGGQDSSARVALSMTLKCILSNDFSIDHINKVQDDMKKEDWKDFISNLGYTQRKFLLNLLNIQSIQKDFKPCDIKKMMPDLTPPRISQLITEFEDNAIIESKYKNLGRAGGRVRVLRFESEDTFNKIEELLECKI